MVVFASGNSISRAPLNPWRKPLRLSCRARRPGPGLRMPTGRGQGHMDLWQQCPGDRVPSSEDDQVVPRQHCACCLLSDLARRWIHLQAVQMPAEGKTGLTEECFTKNVLKFADNKTFWRR